MVVIAYIAALFIGVSLGLIGGGGSILTLPVLVYLFGIEATLATVYSLFIVGTTSLIGATSYVRKGLINFKMALYFGAPSLLAIFLTRRFLFPSIPEILFSIGTFTLSKHLFLLLLFAVVMLFAAAKMIFVKQDVTSQDQDKFYFPQIAVRGLLVGTLTGLIGAGGGFLIIPALVTYLKLPIKQAIGTSLFIISVNSLLGFITALHSEYIDWHFLLGIVAVAAVGIFTGSYLSNKISSKKLKPGFGWFILIMAILILYREVFSN